jgi:hypothetical protein
LNAGLAEFLDFLRGGGYLGMGMGGGGGEGEEEAVGSFPSGSEEKRLRPGVGNEATIAMYYLFKGLDYREMERFFLGFVICCCDLRPAEWKIESEPR